jgi:hypothetical protein
MRLLWVVAALLLLLQPSPAAAGVVASGDDPRPVPVLQDDTSDHRHFARGEGGSELVRICDGRGPRPGPTPTSAHEHSLEPVARLLDGPVAAADPGTFVPTCQRLPYRSTAPPRP